MKLTRYRYRGGSLPSVAARTMRWMFASSPLEKVRRQVEPSHDRFQMPSSYNRTIVVARYRIGPRLPIHIRVKQHHLASLRAFRINLKLTIMLSQFSNQL